MMESWIYENVWINVLLYMSLHYDAAVWSSWKDVTDHIIHLKQKRANLKQMFFCQFF